MPDKPTDRCEFNSGELLVKLDVTMPGSAGAILSVIQRIMAVVQEMGCAAGREFEIEQSLHEALNNAVEHGSAHDPSKQIQCCVACDHDRGMLIIIRDPGPGFDPASIPNPVVGQNIFAEGGRGIYLISQLVDEVQFERGGTEIHMRLKPLD